MGGSGELLRALLNPPDLVVLFRLKSQMSAWKRRSAHETRPEEWRPEAPANQTSRRHWAIVEGTSAAMAPPVQQQQRRGR